MRMDVTCPKCGTRCAWREEGTLFERYRVRMLCPRCETALSESAEPRITVSEIGYWPADAGLSVAPRKQTEDNREP